MSMYYLCLCACVFFPVICFNLSSQSVNNQPNWQNIEFGFCNSQKYELDAAAFREYVYANRAVGISNYQFYSDYIRSPVLWPFSLFPFFVIASATHSSNSLHFRLFLWPFPLWYLTYENYDWENVWFHLLSWHIGAIDWHLHTHSYLGRNEAYFYSTILCEITGYNQRLTFFHIAII